MAYLSDKYNIKSPSIGKRHFANQNAIVVKK